MEQLQGNTLLNYAGVYGLAPLVADQAPSKQGKYLPGSHIPIVEPSFLDNFKDDLVIVFLGILLKRSGSIAWLLAGYFCPQLCASFLQCKLNGCASVGW